MKKSNCCWLAIEVGPETNPSSTCSMLRLKLEAVLWRGSKRGLVKQKEGVAHKVSFYDSLSHCLMVLGPSRLSKQCLKQENCVYQSGQVHDCKELTSLQAQRNSQTAQREHQKPRCERYGCLVLSPASPGRPMGSVFLPSCKRSKPATKFWWP